MPTHHALIAQIAKPDLPAGPEVAGPPKSWGDRHTTALIGSLLLVAFVIFFWAMYVRKRPRRAKGSIVVERASKDSSEAFGSSGRRRRRKRKENHPDNWGRNPTLGETGGLPPARPENPEPPAAR